MTDDFETETFKAKALRSGLVKHPRYYTRRSVGKIKFDVALLKLDKPVNFTKYDKIR